MAAGEGYLDKPLAEKLGLKTGMRAYGSGLPEGYFRWLGTAEGASLFLSKPAPRLDFIHVFLGGQAELQAKLGALAGRLSDTGMLWASWRKGGVNGLSDGDIRAWALKQGLVDIKVCAVNADWSGLKLVRRKELRAVKKNRRP